jgi:hypothetical protein
MDLLHIGETGVGGREHGLYGLAWAVSCAASGVVLVLTAAEGEVASPP